jgi:hypothetical protein
VEINHIAPEHLPNGFIDHDVAISNRFNGFEKDSQPLRALDISVFVLRPRFKGQLKDLITVDRILNAAVDDGPKALLANSCLLGCNFNDGPISIGVIAESNNDAIWAVAIDLLKKPKPVEREVGFLCRAGWPSRAAGSRDLTRRPSLPLPMKKAIQILTVLRFDDS